MRRKKSPEPAADLAVIAAGAAFDHPAYVIEELIDQGLMPRVYKELRDRLHGRALAEVPVSEISEVVLNVLNKRDAEKQQEEGDDDTPRSTPMYPYFEADARFPDPVPEVQRNPDQPATAVNGNGQSTAQSSAPAQGPEDALNDVGEVVSRWKRGMSVANGAMAEIDAILARRN